MTYLRQFMRPIALSMAFVILVTSLPINFAHAAMVSTEQLIEQTDLAGDRDRVVRFMAREDVREQLASLGIDPNEAAQRASSLSDEEVRQIASKLEQLPAGQGAAEAIVGAILLILLVLLITDLLGLTDVFPFIKSQN
jgi:hypothetical protein